MARSTRNTAGRGDSNGGGASAPPAGGSNPTGGGASNGGGASASATGGSAATGAPGAEAASINQLSAAIQQILDDVIPQQKLCWDMCVVCMPIVFALHVHWC